MLLATASTDQVAELGPKPKRSFDDGQKQFLQVPGELASSSATPSPAKPIEIPPLPPPPEKHGVKSKNS